MSAFVIRSTILLVRHAHTDMAGRFCGHADPDLSILGQEQLQEIVQRIVTWPFTKVYSSSLLRARRTAEIIAASRGLKVNIRSGLNEISFGAWEGMSWDEIEALYPADAALWLHHHPAGLATGGEPFLDFQQRVSAEFRHLAKEARNTGIAVVAHAGFIRTALVLVAGVDAAGAWSLPLEYGSITELNYLQERWHANGIATRIGEQPSRA
jgi:broad specificity phosphatase PhoE